MDQTATATLTPEEIVRVATNAPELAKNEFKLGDRKFKIVDLSYDDYILFFSKLEPVLMMFGEKLSRKAGAPLIEGPAMNGSALLNYCRADLPEMVQIIARQTDATITVEEVKALARTPFVLAAIVMQQIEQNRMIGDVASFFGQFLPLLMKGKDLM